MHVVGFRYKNRATHFFVDVNEKATTLNYRRYLDLEVATGTQMDSVFSSLSCEKFN